MKPNISNKMIRVEEALALIQSGQHVVSGLAAAEPHAILSQLHTQASRLKDVSIITCLPMGVYDFFSDPHYKSSFLMEGWFYSGPMRKLHPNGNLSFIPNHLHLASYKRMAYQMPDVYIGNCSEVDEHGYVSLGISNVYEKDIIERAKLVILEMNPNVPRTFGDTQVHVSKVDYFIETSYELPVLADVPSNEKDMKIGRYIADYIDDGATLQLGIGGIPNAVAKALKDKKDIGIHTEMLTDGMMELYEQGVVTGARKNFHKDKMVCTFALGSKKLYDFIHNNVGVEILRGHYVNDPYIIGKNDHMISINTSIEVDLTGQCCSESVGTRQISGTGGQADTAIGAQRSKNGKSFIALYSTAEVRDPLTGEKIIKSKIVPTLEPGAAVSLSRNDVDYVVTEYGVAELRGTNIRERVKRLIQIAHPEFRESLEASAMKLMLW